MAKFVVMSLNYVSSGSRRGLINLDMSADYSYTARQGVSTEDRLSGVRTELGLSGVQTEDTQRQFEDLDLVYRNKTFVIDKDSVGTGGTVSGDKNIIFNGSVIIRPMYDIRDVCIKSPMKKSFSKNSLLPCTDEFVDIYNPGISSDPISFCNYDDRSIVLTDQTQAGFSYIKTSFRKNRSGSSEFYYTTYIDSDAVSPVYTYSLPGELSSGISSYQQYLSGFSGDFTDTNIYGSYVSAVYRIFEPKYSHMGIGFNYVLNLEQTELGVKYDDGNMYGLAAKAKNVLNQLYSQEMDGDGALLRCRSYTGLIETGNDVYLKFTNNIRYSWQYETDEDGLTTVRHVREIDIDNVPYQKVEQFTPIKIGSTTRHKSNLFSVKIKNTTLEYQTSDYAKNVKKDITSAVKEIIEKISPVNTQLYDVQFIG